jgi:hypothetical protein
MLVDPLARKVQVTLGTSTDDFGAPQPFMRRVRKDFYSCAVILISSSTDVIVHAARCTWLACRPRAMYISQ